MSPVGADFSSEVYWITALSFVASSPPILYSLKHYVEMTLQKAVGHMSLQKAVGRMLMMGSVNYNVGVSEDR